MLDQERDARLDARERLLLVEHAIALTPARFGTAWQAAHAVLGTGIGTERAGTGRYGKGFAALRMRGVAQQSLLDETAWHLVGWPNSH
jgi:hypothetical protein